MNTNNESIVNKIKNIKEIIVNTINLMFGINSRIYHFNLFIDEQDIKMTITYTSYSLFIYVDEILICTMLIDNLNSFTINSIIDEKLTTDYLYNKLK